MWFCVLDLVTWDCLGDWWVFSWLSVLSGYLAFGGVFLFFWCLVFAVSGLFLLLILGVACFGDGFGGTGGCGFSG